MSEAPLYRVADAHSVQAFDRFVIIRAGAQLVVVDQHAADERVRLDEMEVQATLVFKAHRRVYHSTLGLRVIKKKKKKATSALFKKSLCSPLCGGT